ncbi:MAG: amylo-alpha-1,6-glucosidase [Gemmatimonadetes bacterium]|nr:amylo-alpha-1,6-glucosidase [Gemmatimonadota bacterium]
MQLGLAFLCAGLGLLCSAAAAAQEAPAGVPRFPVEAGRLALAGPARPGAYLADLGRRAAVLGDETGAFEVWTWPIKLVRDLRLAFKIPEYDAPVPGAALARQVIVRPEGATIVYSHASFTVRQHVFVPLDEPGAIILLDVETVRPLDVLVQLHADFNLAWPGSFGGQSVVWWGERKAFLLFQGGVRNYHGLVGSPFATGGTTHPAHDAPMVPSQFVLKFEAGQVRSSFIPVVVAGGAAPRDSVVATYERLLGGAQRYWEEKLGHYRRVSRELLSLDSPDPRLDQVLEWAKVNLEQQLVCNPDLGCGLVAGFGRAGAGNYRPGFGWYFGGDAAINTLGMDGLGQFELVRRGLLFLAGFQREDGKIPHEISHAAARLPWFSEYPYTWFHGDTTPFWVLACYEYWKASADEGFLREVWPRVVRAFRWAAATDSDGDGLMENPRAGAGAIEVGGLGEALHTDIYLAGVWLAALEGVRELAGGVEDDDVAREADALFARALRSLEERFWLDAPGIYAFALLAADRVAAPGSTPVRARGAGAASGRGAAGAGVRVNDALTVWPATAMAFALLDAERSDRMLREVGSAAITADWGARMLSQYHRLYEPLHYNNGTVWPFVTGFAALAHYRYHRGWAGFDLVRDVARLTFDFARGRHPELLSGAFYQVLDTSVPQQFFATSMLVTPLVRGLLGLEADAPRRAVGIEPHLPADWDSVSIENFRVGAARLGLMLRRSRDSFLLSLRLHDGGAGPLHVRVAPALPLGATVQRVTVNERDAPVQVEETAHDVHAVVELTLADEALVEIEFRGGVEVVTPAERLTPGQPSEGLRVLDFRRAGREYLLLLEGLAGRSYALELRTAARLRNLRGAERLEQEEGRARLRSSFPAGAGYTRREVRFSL